MLFKRPSGCHGTCVTIGATGTPAAILAAVLVEGAAASD
jgi:hypothetical protein